MEKELQTMTDLQETDAAAYEASGADSLGAGNTEAEKSSCCCGERRKTRSEKEYKDLLTLTLMKGGKAKAEDPQKRPVEVASLPVSAAGFPSGREVVFLPALLDILQDYVTRAMRSDGAGYSGFDIYSRQVRKTGIKRIFFSEDDLVPDMGEDFKKRYFDADMLIMSEEEADKAFQDGTYNTLVSYVVAPFDPKDGSWCYKMLIDAGTHELLYYRHHRISARNWAGFLPKDIKAIFSRR